MHYDNLKKSAKTLVVLVAPLTILFVMAVVGECISTKTLPGMEVLEILRQLPLLFCASVFFLPQCIVVLNFIPLILVPLLCLFCRHKTEEPVYWGTVWSIALLIPLSAFVMTALVLANH